MDSETSSFNCTLYLLLFISITLVAVDTIEIVSLVKAWSEDFHINPDLFKSCIKWELIVKTCFTFFSFFGAISALVLSLMLFTDYEFLNQKLLSPYLHGNYFIFGPFMLAFCLMGLFNWSNVVYTCEKRNFESKELSATNTFSLLACLIFSVMITLCMLIYKTVAVYTNSVLNRPDGSGILRGLFLWGVTRSSDSSSIADGEQ